MTRISLCGVWKRSIAGGPEFDQSVPYSAFPCGESELRTRFDSPAHTGRTLLRFEGITYKAQVWLNGEPVGEMLPYSVYRFDVTDLMRAGGNELRVRVTDMRVPFGPSEGWENYGGIIRGVYLDLVPSAYVDDVYFRARFGREYRSATACVTVSCVNAEGMGASVRLLSRDGDTVAAGAAVVKGGICELELAVDRPRLWSPEEPYLYSLEVRLGDHVHTLRVGFKDLRIAGRGFLLNGRPLFLRGVCRHDLWGDAGHTMSDDMIRRDLTMIKATGANFVRLVHYPHDERVLHMADEMGLLVSDEPGLWWSDMHDKAIVDGALKVMERAVIRDRSHVSVAFWLAFNECVFTEEYLMASAALCRRLDPTRPVSGANCMNLDMTRKLFAKCGFDFYTYHPYGATETTLSGSLSFDGIMDALCDKPLVFTEWGGYFTEDNNYLFTRFLQKLLDSGREGRLAGFSYWLWADMYEFGRGEPDCIEGRLYEGLVDIYRGVRPMYNTFMHLLSTWDAPLEPKGRIQAYAVGCPEGDYACIPLDADAPGQTEARAQVLADSLNNTGYVHKRTRRLTNGPVPPQSVGTLGGLPTDIRAGWPLVVAGAQEIAVGMAAQELFLVCGSMPWSWPTHGEAGERMGALTLLYEDGAQERIELLNGVHVATALGSIGPSRIEPRARLAQPALRFSHDLNWEHYCANACAFPVDASRVLRAVRIEYDKPGALLLFAMTARK